ncbi:enoyl-CoA hydratase/isomerase family protein [Chitinasiproducens palmae]|uniref:Enoyl-CoA hydratase n=1 Tax=Chitinasiproducens palmae TaxID=1770053 RepID=A0A1H2PPX0_9BURK|nr:enoyl-CoA hydratase/isomerase family protein [Chitinasiproducens palmae]SDV48371.1 enoyl-CoA hydratase [Chitinasiproducens palmae]
MHSDAPDYSSYRSLAFERPAEGVIEIVMQPGRNRSGLPTTDRDGHRELAHVWRDIDADPSVRAAVLRGTGPGFSGGGDLALVEEMIDTFEARARVWREASELVYNLINCSKPVVSAIHGPAVGAGLVAGLLADISVAGRGAKIVDGHTRLGVAAGDHAAIVWPLLCGMAKAKYHLLLCEPIDGAEAERIGLVSVAVEDGTERERALAIAERLAEGSQTALRWTKHTLNNWLRLAGPSFDASLALEMLGFTGPDAREGVASLRERREPRFTRDEPFGAAPASARPAARDGET